MLMNDESLNVTKDTPQEFINNASTTTTTEMSYSTSPMSNMTTVNMTITATTWLTTIDSNASECPKGLTWIRDHFGDCIETTTQLFAFSCAMVAVAMWVLGHFL